MDDDERDSQEFADAYAKAFKTAARVVKENRQDVRLGEDAVQEAALKLLLRKKKDGIRNWFAFLQTSVRHEVGKFMRKRRWLRQQEMPNLPVSQVNSADQIFNRILVDELEKQVPEKELEIVRLHEFQGLDFNEIAAAKNISVDAARKRYYRNRQAIREILGLENRKEGPRNG